MAIRSIHANIHMHEWTYTSKRQQEEQLDLVLIGVASNASALPLQTSGVKRELSDLTKYAVDLATITEACSALTLCDSFDPLVCFVLNSGPQDTESCCLSSLSLNRDYIRSWMQVECKWQQFVENQLYSWNRVKTTGVVSRHYQLLPATTSVGLKSYFIFIW